jgi:hypothetical protein
MQDERIRELFGENWRRYDLIRTDQFLPRLKKYNKWAAQSVAAGTFKDYVRDRADLNKDKPVIPAAALAGYTGRTPGLLPPAGVGSLDTSVLSPAPKGTPFLGDKKTLRGWVSFSGHSADSH